MKKNKKAKSTDYEKRLNPMITVDANEQLFAIVDFSLPGTNRVRRILSKRCEDGAIFAVSYLGTVGADRTCHSKTNILKMRNASEEKFWASVKALEELYLAAGGTVEIRNYAGKTMREAAEQMKRLGNARVWMDGDVPAM